MASLFPASLIVNVAFALSCIAVAMLAAAAGVAAALFWHRIVGIVLASHGCGRLSVYRSWVVAERACGRYRWPTRFGLGCSRWPVGPYGSIEGSRSVGRSVGKFGGYR